MPRNTLIEQAAKAIDLEIVYCEAGGVYYTTDRTNGRLKDEEWDPLKFYMDTDMLLLKLNISVRYFGKAQISRVLQTVTPSGRTIQNWYDLSGQYDVDLNNFCNQLVQLAAIYQEDREKSK